MGTTANCRACGRPAPLEVQMTTKAGQTVALQSCPRCETRTWLADGEQISSDDLYRIASGNPDFRLQAARSKPSRAAR